MSPVEPELSVSLFVQELWLFIGCAEADMGVSSARPSASTTTSGQRRTPRLMPCLRCQQS